MSLETEWRIPSEIESLMVAAIVEGSGDKLALPVLLRRLVPYLDFPGALELSAPHRIPKSRLLKQGQLEAAVNAAAFRVPIKGGLILVLMDADDDCPASAGPPLLARAQDVAMDRTVALVLANREFEAWFLASAPSLAGKRGLPDPLAAHPAPESVRDAKRWLTDQMAGTRSYKETADQPAFAAIFDLGIARQNAPSFDKLCRDLLAVIQQAAG